MAKVQVKLLVSRCGNGDPQLPGQTITVDSAEAQRMIDDQQAVPVEAETKPPAQSQKKAKNDKPNNAGSAGGDSKPADPKGDDGAQ